MSLLWVPIQERKLTFKANLLWGYVEIALCKLLVMWFELELDLCCYQKLGEVANTIRGKVNDCSRVWGLGLPNPIKCVYNRLWEVFWKQPLPIYVLQSTEYAPTDHAKSGERNSISPRSQGRSQRSLLLQGKSCMTVAGSLNLHAWDPELL